MKFVRSFLFLLFLCGSQGRAITAEPFTVALPSDFSGPFASSFGSTRIFTYVRPTHDPDFRTLFIVTLSPILESEKNDVLAARLEHLLRAMSGRLKNFKKAEVTPCVFAGQEGLCVNWEGDSRGRAIKGRILCTARADNFVYLTLQDLSEDWDKNLPDLEKATSTFALRK